MKKALGLIETRGLVAAVAAADKALKSARIVLEGKEITEPGYVTIRFSGELTEIQIAVASGSEAARDTGELISSIVIADPDAQLSVLLSDEKVNHSSPLAPLEITHASVDHISVDAKKVLPVKKKGANEAGSKKSEGIVKKSRPVKMKEETELSVPSQAIVSKHTSAEITEPDVLQTADNSPAAEGVSSVGIKKVHQGVKRITGHQKKNEVLDTITRLRMEALGKKEESRSESLTVKEAAGQDLVELNVHQLRKLARNTPDFPIFGRKISKANRDELLKLFNGIKN